MKHSVRILILSSFFISFGLLIFGTIQKNLALPTLAQYSSTESNLSDELAEDASQLNLSGVKSVQNNIVYSTINGQQLLMDLYFPTTPKSNPAPVVMYVHGGGWNHGDKKLGHIVIDLPRLMNAGYVVAAINYRLSPQAKFPDFINDTTNAIAFLQNNAPQYNINPQRIGLWGTSSGGQIASYIAVSQTELQSIKAVVVYSGIYDLRKNIFNDKFSEVIEQAFGAKPGSGDPILTKASPITNILSNKTALLIVHSISDSVAPLSQTTDFITQLKNHNFVYKYEPVTGSGHRLSPKSGQTMSPTRNEIGRKMVRFFNEHL